MTHATEKLIETIANDAYSGSSAIGRQCAECFISLSYEEEYRDTRAFTSAVIGTACRLIDAQPEMASVLNLCRSIQLTAQEAERCGEDSETSRSLIRDIAFDYLRQIPKALEKIAQYGADWLQDGDLLMTLSCSATFKAIIEAACKMGKEIGVVIGESRPSWEGRHLAKQLGQFGVSTTLVVDAAMLQMLPECTKVLVGADWIDRHLFANKVGTLALALGAQYTDKEFWIAAETSKIIDDPSAAFECRSQHPAHEVWTEETENVLIENIYFDSIPLELVTGLICEKGILPRDTLPTLFSGR